MTCPFWTQGWGGMGGPVMVPSAHTPSLGARPKALRGQATCRGPHLVCGGGDGHTSAKM